MGTLRITCPATGKEISTGVRMDKEAWETYEAENTQMNCPACGGTHTWGKSDAFVRDDD